MLNSIQAVLSLFVLMAIGVVIGKQGWIGADAKAAIGRLASGIAVPATIFHSITTSFTKESLSTAGKDMLAPILSVAVLFVLCYIFGKYVLRLRWGRLGTFYAIAGSNNTIFIGVSIVTIVFPDYVSYAVYYFLAVTIFFWTAGIGGMKRDAGESSGFSLLTVVKNLLTPHVITMLAALLVVALNIPIPRFVQLSVSSLGGMSTPLCLIYSGITIYEMARKYGGLQTLKPDRDTLAVYAVRFIISPLLMMLFCLLFGIAGTGRTVLIIMAAMPTMSQSVIMSGVYGADEEFAAKAYVGSTMLCMLVIPFYLTVFPG